MRLIFVTPRFRARDATPPERLAEELAKRAPGGWRTTVLTTTAAGHAQEAFHEGQFQKDGVRVVRFPAETPSPAGAARRADSDNLSSPALLEHLAERDDDLVVLFGSSPRLCLEAAKVDPRRTVLLPFAEGETADSGDSEIFNYPAALVFGSEAEEVLVLKRYRVHRRMRETIAGSLLLPRSVDAAAFRSGAGLSGHYLIEAGPLEPGRGVEELVRFFCTFRERHPEAALELVLLGSPGVRIPKRPDLRVLQPENLRKRLDAVAGALVAVIPARLAGFSAAAAEPFSLGVPILVNASATALTEECRASGGGLYYQNYDEFELILELGLRDPTLFSRMGAAGRSFLQSKYDWDLVLARYDRAFRSFARPSRTGAAETAPGGTEAGTVVSGAGQPEEAGEQPSEGASPEAHVSEEISPEQAVEASPDSGEPAVAGSPLAPGEVPEPETAARPGDDAADAPPSGDEAPVTSEDDFQPEGSAEPGGVALPSFFRGSLRD